MNNRLLCFLLIPLAFASIASGAEPAAREAIRWLERSVADEPRIVEDGQRLKKILKMDPVELCKRQCGK